MRRLHPATAEQRARMKALAEAPLPAERFREALELPIGEEEMDEALSLIRWFRRRYPTPGERLAYARRAYRRWTRALDGA